MVSIGGELSTLQEMPKMFHSKVQGKQLQVESAIERCSFCWKMPVAPRSC